MMDERVRILNFGSLNIDYVYQVPHFVLPGETVAADHLVANVGGKGLNQSVALARAGAHVFHAGNIGSDGSVLKECLNNAGVDTSLLATVDRRTGHAIIQVDSTGENSIILYGGANQTITRDYMDSVLEKFSAGDALLLQNEINDVEYLLRQAVAKGMRVFLNPAPMDKAAAAYPLQLVECVFVNEIEAAQLAGIESGSIDKVASVLQQRFPNVLFVYTLGSDGSIAACGEKRFHQKAYSVDAIDTTAAGDTFTGFFVERYMSGRGIQESLDIASKASSIAVTRPGAASSIPSINEVLSTDFSDAGSE